MRNILLLIGGLITLCLPMHAQSGVIPVNSTKLTDASGNLISNATVCGQVVTSTATPMSIHLGGGGQTTQPPVCSTVTNGAFTINLPNVALANPQPCIALTVTDNSTGNTLLASGYGCVQPTSAAGSNWCSTVNGSTSCNFDVYTPNFTSQAIVQTGPPGPPGPVGPVGPAGGALNTNVNPWSIGQSGQTFYWEGPSTLRAPHANGTYISGSSLPGGGIPGNYAYIVSTSVWGAGHGVYYNDGQDGSTSAQALARYTTGNSTNGVTVPSPHSVSPAQTCSTWTTAPASCPREIFFYDMGTIYNDTNAGISQAQSEQNVINTVADAHADGYFVVIMPTYLIQVGNVALTAQIQAINLDTYRGATGADLIAPMDQWLTDATDPVLIDVDHIHPTVKGDQFLASRLMSFLISGGTQDNYTSYYATEIYAAGGMQVLPLGGTPSPLLAPFQVGSQGAAPTGGEGTEGTVFGRLDGCQFSVQKNTGNPEQIAFCVYDSGNYAAIQSAQMGVGNTPLELNPLGGSVLTGPGGLQGTPNGTTAAQTLHGIDQLSATDTVRTPVPAQSCIDYHLPVTGLLTSGAINVPIISGSLGNLSLTAYASTTAGQMNMHFCNPSAVTVTPPANTYYWLQFR